MRFDAAAGDRQRLRQRRDPAVRRGRRRRLARRALTGAAGYLLSMALMYSMGVARPVSGQREHVAVREGGDQLVRAAVGDVQGATAHARRRCCR